MNRQLKKKTELTGREAKLLRAKYRQFNLEKGFDIKEHMAFIESLNKGWPLEKNKKRKNRMIYLISIGVGISIVMKELITINNSPMVDSILVRLSGLLTELLHVKEQT